MSASVEIACVDPARIHEVWPVAAPLIRRAMERTNLSRFDDVEKDILGGMGFLWLAGDGSKILAAATTCLVRTHTDKVCILTACAGEQMPRWRPLLAVIEAYAKAEGCASLRIYGRKGWARVLDDYDVTHIVLEKGLT